MANVLKWIALFMTIVSGPLGAHPAIAQPIALTNVRILDGNGGPPIERGTVVVAGNKIVAVGPSGTVVIPTEAHRIDAAGKTAMPGLADLHVHLTGGWDGESPDFLSFQRFLKSFLYAGVTAVLDTGNVEPYVLQLRAETAAGRLVGPRIYCVGPILDGADPFWPPASFVVTSAQQVPPLIKHLAAEHVDLIKLYAGLSDAVISAVSDEAKKYDLRTVIDAHERNGSVDIMSEGISGWAHFPDHRLSDDAIALAKERRIFFITTLAVKESFSRRRFSDMSFLDNSLIAPTTAPRDLEQIRALGAQSHDAKQERTRSVWVERLREAESNVRRLHDSGILIAAGTDAPYPGVPYGEGIHRELELLVEAGLTPLQALTVATKNAASVMNADKEWGTLEPGKIANIVLVEGKPDHNIGDTRKIAAVMKDGAVLDREKLRFDSALDPGYRPVGSIAATIPR